MPESTVIICIDGLDPEYLDACETPNLRDLARKGFLKTGRSMMPSVTNVNNVSLITASYPESHGISSNYRLVRETGEEIYMESSEYILTETIFQRAATVGKTSLIVTSKDKLRTLLTDGATLALSSEQPLDWVVKEIGEPPPIYSLEVNGWMIRAGDLVMSRRGPFDIVYLTTTDYAMHTYAPDEPESQQHLTILDDAIGDLVAHHPDVTLLLTADHGMSSKREMVDLKAALSKYGIAARAVPIIKDRYTVHHSNLGGFMFVYLDHISEMPEAAKVLRETTGVDYVLTREEAADELRLHYERIGDLVVNGTKDVVFGDPNEVELPPRLRSHASTYEQAIPLLGYNGDFDGFTFEENRDLGRYVFERVLA